MQKTKLRRQKREKVRLEAKLIQHERSMRINKGEEPRKVDADMAKKYNTEVEDDKMEEVKGEEDNEEKKEKKEKAVEDLTLTLAKKLMTEGDQIQEMIAIENICEHQPDFKLFNVVEAMINKFVEGGKSVTDFKTPQILVLTQDTLVVTALYKELRDKFKMPDIMRKYVKGEKPLVHLHKLFARHIPLA